MRPKYVTLPNPDRLSYGPQIQRVADRLGGALFPFQRYVTSCATEQLADGLGGWEPAYDTVVMLINRRGGKTFIVKAVSTERGLRSKARIAYTAQHGNAAAWRWREIADAEASAPPDKGLKQVLGDTVHVTAGVGNEKLTWRETGSEFFPFAPNEKSGHGGAYDLVWVDELWAHSLVTKQLVQQGYRPMWSVKPGQEWLMSAAGTSASGWLHEVRRLGRRSVNDPSSRLFYIEFGVPDDVDVHSLSDSALVDVTLEYHPRRGFGLREGYLRTELDVLGRAGFLRAYANRDSEDDAVAILTAEVRKRQTAETRIPRGVVCSVGVALDDQRRESTVAMAWQSPDGPVIIESVTRPGVRWVAAYVAHAPGVANVAIGNSRMGRGAADGIEAEWADASKDLAAKPLLRVSQADMVAACGQWLAGVEEDGSVYFASSQEMTAVLRDVDLPVGGQWVPRGLEPITVIQAHTLALWAADHVTVEPEPEFWIY